MTPGIRKYSFNGLAGCVTQRRARATGTTVSIYHAEQAELDPAGGPWVTVCEEHGAICNHDTLALALLHTSWPEWCEDCQEKLVLLAPSLS